MPRYTFLQLAIDQIVSRNPRNAQYLEQYNRTEHSYHLNKIVGRHRHHNGWPLANGSQFVPVGNSLGSSSGCAPPTSCSSGNTCCPNGYGLWNCTCNTGSCTKMIDYWLCTFI